MLMLFTQLLLGLPSGLSPSGFPSKSLYASLFFFFSLMHATCPNQFILLDFITLTIPGEEYKL